VNILIVSHHAHRFGRTYQFLSGGAVAVRSIFARKTTQGRVAEAKADFGALPHCLLEAKDRVVRDRSWWWCGLRRGVG